MSKDEIDKIVEQWLRDQEATFEVYLNRTGEPEVTFTIKGSRVLEWAAAQ